MALTHAVMFTLAEPGDAAEAAKRLRAMAGRIPSLLSIEAGTSADGGAPHLLLVTRHDDAKALQDYQDHPVHQELLGWIRPRIVGRTVVDSVDVG